MATKKKSKYAVVARYSDGGQGPTYLCATLEEAKKLATKESYGGRTISIYERKFEAAPVPVELKAVCD